jgi:hypothetical protein
MVMSSSLQMKRGDRVIGGLRAVHSVDIWIYPFVVDTFGIGVGPRSFGFFGASAFWQFTCSTCNLMKYIIVNTTIYLLTSTSKLLEAQSHSL